MRTASRSLLLAILAVVVPVVSAAPAHAAPPRLLEGESQVIFFEELSRRVVGDGNVTLTEFRNQAVVTGDVVSTVPQEERARCVIRTETLTCHGTAFLTGQIEGVGEGTLTSRVHVSCVLATGECAGRSVPVSGTGDLAGLAGHTTFTGELYTGHFTYQTLILGP